MWAALDGRLRCEVQEVEGEGQLDEVGVSEGQRGMVVGAWCSLCFGEMLVEVVSSKQKGMSRRSL